MSLMKAAVLKSPGHIQIEEVSIPEVREDDVLIKVDCTGICGSDILAYQGAHPYKKAPVVLGHEFCGKIIDVGTSLPRSLIGKKVCGAAYSHCDECYYCEIDKPNLCNSKSIPSYESWQGSFAQYVIAKSNSFHIVDSSVPNEWVALIEPLTIAWHTLKLANNELKAGTIGILGAGSIGLSCASLARYFGFDNVICFDINSGKRLQVEALGASFFLNDDEVRNCEIRPAQPDLTVVSSGHKGALNEALVITKPGGKIIVPAYFKSEENVNVNLLVAKEIALIGAALSDTNDFTQIISLLESRSYNPSAIITHRLMLSDIKKAVELVIDSSISCGKVMLNVTP